MSTCMGVEVYPLPTEPGPFLDLYRADMKKYFPNLALPPHDQSPRLSEGCPLRGALPRTGRKPHRESCAQGDRIDQGTGPAEASSACYGGDVAV